MKNYFTYFLFMLDKVYYNWWKYVYLLLNTYSCFLVLLWFFREDFTNVYYFIIVKKELYFVLKLKKICKPINAVNAMNKIYHISMFFYFFSMSSIHLICYYNLVAIINVFTFIFKLMLAFILSFGFCQMWIHVLPWFYVKSDDLYSLYYFKCDCQVLHPVYLIW